MWPRTSSLRALGAITNITHYPGEGQHFTARFLPDYPDEFVIVADDDSEDVNRIDNSELITVPGVGHRPAEERPTLVAEFVHTWLEKAITAPSVRYSANVSASQSRTAALITPSFESGD